MATQPSPEELKRLNDQQAAAFAAKVKQQAEAGKSFNIPADGHGPGVIPEAIWKQQKTKQLAPEVQS